MNFINAMVINLAVTAIWYQYEYQQFKELQWNRKCEVVVSTIYFLIIWYLIATR